ncbi:MAG: hypothetical protein AB7J40_01310 [Candidatus Altimarinota bacterium]
MRRKQHCSFLFVVTNPYQRGKTVKKSVAASMFMLAFLLIAASSTGCGDKDRSIVIAPITSEGYTLKVLPPNITRLEIGEKQVFKFEVKAHEDIFIDRIVAKFHSTGTVWIEEVEARDGTAITLVNSHTLFHTPPTFPLEMPIVFNSFIPQGTTKTYFIFLDLTKVDPNSTLRMDLLMLTGKVTNRGIDLYPLPETLNGPTISSGMPRPEQPLPHGGGCSPNTSGKQNKRLIQ